MENKYNKYFWEFEQKNKDNARSINTSLNKQFNSKDPNEIFGRDYFESICLNYHLYNNDLKEWVKREVLPHFTEETLISCYLIKLTDALMLKEEGKPNSIMNSFREIGLIKDIELKEDKIILTTKNNEVVKFKSLFNDEEGRNQFRSRCHSGCEFLIRNHETLKKGSAIITLRDSFIGKYPIYHSIILSKRKYIIDPARNLVMKLDDYKRLFKLDIIMCIDRETMLEEIDRLKETDSDFNKSNLSNVLKLAMHKQMKKGRNMARH